MLAVSKKDRNVPNVILAIKACLFILLTVFFIYTVLALEPSVMLLDIICFLCGYVVGYYLFLVWCF
jgi:hypothetical protein